MASKSVHCDACPTEIFCGKAELSRKFTCPQCNVDKSTMSHLKRHLQIHESNRIRRFKCTVDSCDKRFYSAKTAKRHVARVHSTEKPFPCPFQCGKCFKTKMEVKLHLLTHTKEKPYKCEECDSSFRRGSHLQSHIKYLHTSPYTKPHPCTQCFKVLKTVQELKRHNQRVHKQIKNFLCSDCPKKFFSKTELTRHSATHDAERQLVDCYFCSKKLMTRSNFERHLRTHTTEKPSSCPEKSCKYSSTISTSSDVCRHERSIHGQSQDRKKHTCYFCSATFFRNDGIRSHMRIHTLEEPFSCQLCRKSCKTSSELSQHVRVIHTKEKPHKCNQCEQCFSSKEKLEKHAAAHTKEKRFFCETCSYSSYRSGDVTRHLRMVHGIAKTCK